VPRGVIDNPDVSGIVVWVWGHRVIFAVSFDFKRERTSLATVNSVLQEINVGLARQYAATDVELPSSLKRTLGQSGNGRG
jgi:hypothetical protein